MTLFDEKPHKIRAILAIFLCVCLTNWVHCVLTPDQITALDRAPNVYPPLFQPGFNPMDFLDESSVEKVLATLELTRPSTFISHQSRLTRKNKNAVYTRNYREHLKERMRKDPEFAAAQLEASRRRDLRRKQSKYLLKREDPMALKKKLAVNKIRTREARKRIERYIAKNPEALKSKNTPEA